MILENLYFWSISNSDVIRLDGSDLRLSTVTASGSRAVTTGVFIRGKREKSRKQNKHMKENTERWYVTYSVSVQSSSKSSPALTVHQTLSSKVSSFRYSFFFPSFPRNTANGTSPVASRRANSPVQQSNSPDGFSPKTKQ